VGRNIPGFYHSKIKGWHCGIANPSTTGEIQEQAGEGKPACSFSKGGEKD
jgi:hypothetical protein